MFQSLLQKIILVIVTHRYLLQNAVLVFLHPLSHGQHPTTLGGRDYPNFIEEGVEPEEEMSV